MDRTNDNRFKRIMTNADNILLFFDNPQNTDLNNDEWLELAQALWEWLGDVNIPETERWKVRLSGYPEMVKMATGQKHATVE